MQGENLACLAVSVPFMEEEKEYPYSQLLTVVHVVSKDKRFLLAERKSNYCKGVLAAYGGKMDQSDPTVRDCAAREVLEESGLKCKNLTWVGRMLTRVAGRSDSLIHYYLCTEWEGNPVETDEMGEPRWYECDQLPYSRMFPSAELYIPIIMRSRTFYLQIEVSEGEKINRYYLKEGDAYDEPLFA